MQEVIAVRIKTMSNLFIGGATTPFVIGGIDQQTVCDQEGFPYIPGSSLKGALRAMVREDDSAEAKQVAGLFQRYMRDMKEKNQSQLDELVTEKEARLQIENNYQAVIEKASAEQLFGIAGFNGTPKLLFGDLRLCDADRNKESCFSIDMKNTIISGDEGPRSLPRTYQTARCGLVFEGEIQLHKIGLMGDGAEELCRRYICGMLDKFNDGIYRLGNSKSRGYGKVEIHIGDESEAG